MCTTFAKILKLPKALNSGFLSQSHDAVSCSISDPSQPSIIESSSPRWPKYGPTEAKTSLVIAQRLPATHLLERMWIFQRRIQRTLSQPKRGREKAPPPHHQLYCPRTARSSKCRPTSAYIRRDIIRKRLIPTTAPNNSPFN